MANTLRIKRRITGSPGAPSALKNAELAYNEVDNVLYYGKGDAGDGSATSIIQIGGTGVFATKSYVDTSISNADLSSYAKLGASNTFTAGFTNTFNGATNLVGAFQLGGTAVTADADELNLLDGALPDTVVNSKAVIYGSAGDIRANSATFSSVTTSGSVTALVGFKLDPSSKIALTSSGLNVSDNTSSANATITPNGNITTVGSLTAATISAGGNATVGGNLTVTGNLTINGTTTTVNSTTVTIDDPIFTIGGDTAPSVDDNKDRGIEFRWHNGTAAKVGFFGFDDSTGKFAFIPDATNTSEVFSGTPGTIDVGAVHINGSAFGVSNLAGLGASVGTFLATPTSDNLRSAVTGTTGTGNLVFARNPSFNIITSDATTLSWSFGVSDSAANLFNMSTAQFVFEISPSGAITKGSWQANTIALAYGGTGATTAAGARANLGLVINTDVQAYDDDLAALAGLTSAADALPYFTGSATAATTTLSSFGRTLIDDADAATARTTLGLGTIATQNANNVAITGGTIDNVVLDGGTF